MKSRFVQTLGISDSTLILFHSSFLIVYTCFIFYTCFLDIVSPRLLRNCNFPRCADAVRENELGWPESLVGRFSRFFTLHLNAASRAPQTRFAEIRRARLDVSFPSLRRLADQIIHSVQPGKCVVPAHRMRFTLILAIRKRIAL